MYRRNLPHWYPPGARVFITWRLAGCLPICKLIVKDGRDFLIGDRLLDEAKTGPMWLRHSDVAQCVIDQIVSQTETIYELHAFVLMPNHVHLLITPWRELAEITRVLKGPSARIANKLLKRTGVPFWQDESFDHWIRHRDQFDRVKRYIEQNPVKAGFVQSSELWPYSSANPSQAEACATNRLVP